MKMYFHHCDVAKIRSISGKWIPWLSTFEEKPKIETENGEHKWFSSDFHEEIIYIEEYRLHVYLDRTKFSKFSICTDGSSSATYNIVTSLFLSIFVILIISEVITYLFFFFGIKKLRLKVKNKQSFVFTSI